jgi:hypothetical protein
MIDHAPRAARASRRLAVAGSGAARPGASRLVAGFCEVLWPLGLPTPSQPAEACVTLATAAHALPEKRERAAAAAGLRARIGEWSETTRRPPPANEAVRPGEARSRLAARLGVAAEPRPQQADYATAVTAPLRRASSPTSLVPCSPKP